MIERRATRFYFGGIAKIIDLDSRRELVGISRDLSLSETFVKTSEPFASGTVVRVRLTASGTDFAATGRVTGNVTQEGMGIEFVEVSAKDRAILETWLSIRKNVFSPTMSCGRLIRSGFPELLGSENECANRFPFSNRDQISVVAVDTWLRF